MEVSHQVQVKNAWRRAIADAANTLIMSGLRIERSSANACLSSHRSRQRKATAVSEPLANLRPPTALFLASGDHGTAHLSADNRTLNHKEQSCADAATKDDRWQWTLSCVLPSCCLLETMPEPTSKQRPLKEAASYMKAIATIVAAGCLQLSPEYSSLQKKCS